MRYKTHILRRNLAMSILGTYAQLQKATISSGMAACPPIRLSACLPSRFPACLHVCLSVCPSSWNNLDPTAPIFMKFDI